MLKKYQESYKQKNLTLLEKLPKDEYLQLMKACDVGLVFLRYTAQTPNFPSRILSYMEYSMPILSCTDPVSDMNQIIENGNFGIGCLSDDPKNFYYAVQRICTLDIGQMGINGRKYLEKNYAAKNSYELIKYWYETMENK